MLRSEEQERAQENDLINQYVNDRTTPEQWREKHAKELEERKRLLHEKRAEYVKLRAQTMALDRGMTAADFDRRVKEIINEDTFYPDAYDWMRGAKKLYQKVSGHGRYAP
jgi:hypothetical protein